LLNTLGSFILKGNSVGLLRKL